MLGLEIVLGALPTGPENASGSLTRPCLTVAQPPKRKHLAEAPPLSELSHRTHQQLSALDRWKKCLWIMQTIRSELHRCWVRQSSIVTTVETPQGSIYLPLSPSIAAPPSQGPSIQLKLIWNMRYPAPTSRVLGLQSWATKPDLSSAFKCALRFCNVHTQQNQSRFRQDWTPGTVTFPQVCGNAIGKP